MDMLCSEPTLDELLADSAARLLMHGDGLTESDVRAVLFGVKRARTLPERERVS
jgi:hypothetical protein